MASIHKRGSTWQVKWREPEAGHLRQRARTVHSADAARRLLREVQTAEDLGQRWEPEGLRRVPGVAEVAEAWLREIAATCAPRTAITYGQRLDLLEEHLQRETGRDRVTLADLSRERLASGHAWLLQSMSRGTARGVLMTWSQWWTWAWTSETYGPDAPRPQRLRLREEVRPAVSSPTYAEIDAMIEHLAGRRRCRRGEDWETRCAVVARYTGMRLGAVLQLDWGDVDLGRGQLVVRPEITKGRRGGRTLPIHPGLAEELAGWGRREGPLCPWGNVSLAAASSSMCERAVGAWAKTGARPEVYRGRPDHCMRRALRTHLSAAGVAPDIIDTITGHQRMGTGGRVYTDPAMLWPGMVAAIGVIPWIGVGSSVVVLGREDSG